MLEVNRVLDYFDPIDSNTCQSNLDQSHPDYVNLVADDLGSRREVRWACGPWIAPRLREQRRETPAQRNRGNMEAADR